MNRQIVSPTTDSTIRTGGGCGGTQLDSAE